MNNQRQMVTHSKFFTLIALGIGLTSCATDGGGKSTRSPQGDGLKTEQGSETYNKNVRLQNANEVRSGDCAKLATGIHAAKYSDSSALKAATHCLAAKDWSRSEDIGRLISLKEPASPWGPYVLATVAKGKGEKERALWMVQLALRRGSQIAGIHYLRGQILWSLEDHPAAVASFEKAVEIDSSLIAANLFLGQIYYREQNFQRASKYFYSVLKIQPRNATALSGLAESELRSNNLGGALDAYTRLVDAYPQEVKFKLRLQELEEMDRFARGDRRVAGAPGSVK